MDEISVVVRLRKLITQLLLKTIHVENITYIFFFRKTFLFITHIQNNYWSIQRGISSRLSFGISFSSVARLYVYIFHLLKPGKNTERGLFKKKKVPSDDVTLPRPRPSTSGPIRERDLDSVTPKLRGTLWDVSFIIKKDSFNFSLTGEHYHLRAHIT